MTRSSNSVSFDLQFGQRISAIWKDHRETESYCQNTMISGYFNLTKHTEGYCHPLGGARGFLLLQLAPGSWRVPVWHCDPGPWTGQLPPGFPDIVVQNADCGSVTSEGLIYTGYLMESCRSSLRTTPDSQIRLAVPWPWAGYRGPCLKLRSSP